MTVAVADHNDARWLRVEYRTKRWGKKGWGFEPGWYVVRTCPCHLNRPVTLAKRDRESAEQAMAALLRVSESEAADG